MDKTRIEDLRRRSRILLAQADENSRRIQKGIRQLHSQDLTPVEDCTNRENGRKNWRLRNDSREVRQVLNPDYSSSSISTESMPNIKPLRKILITSKKHTTEKCLENVKRKPVKECYCNADVKKIQPRFVWTQHKHAPPPNRPKSCIDFKPAIVIENRKPILASPISCETLKRMEQIDYTPRSNFLRYCQNKAYLLQNRQMFDCPETCQASIFYRKSLNEKAPANAKSASQLKISSKETVGTQTLEEGHENQATNVEYLTANNSNKEVPVPPSTKQSKSGSMVKRSLSKKSLPELEKKSHSIVSTKGKNSPINVRNPCHCQDELEKIRISGKSRNSINSEDYESTTSSNSDRSEKLRCYDRYVTDLRNFREENYFDTHGSSRTLLSSDSSGSCDQYLLNKRLFPEPYKNIHKKDLVVTMPACATVQRKRVHYFPRYIVRQEKMSCNANSKRRRHQNCPLTGHAVDLGILKCRPPMNSLALKYQKRFP